MKEMETDRILGTSINAKFEVKGQDEVSWNTDSKTKIKIIPLLSYNKITAEVNFLYDNTK